MHPIERLRYVARSTGAAPDDVVQEAAGSLAAFADDPVALVTACRRLLDRHPANGPVWSLCARTVVAADPADEVWRCASEFHGDRSPRALGDVLPDDAVVAVVGWQDRLGAAAIARGDVQVRVIDVDGDGPGFVRALERLDVDAVDVPVGGMAPAVASADLVVLVAGAIGPRLALCDPGSWAAAAVARAAEVPVWLLGGVGRTFPAPMWEAVVARLGRPGREAWERGHDLVPLELVDQVAGPGGLRPATVAAADVDVPDAPELRR